MSERILKALMQLFAIVARPDDSDSSDRHRIVEGFLRKQLNQELAKEYLAIFEYHYNTYQKKYKDRNKYQKRTMASSVRLLVICDQINKELNQSEKVTLMVLLLSFIKTGHGAVSTISEFEERFVKMVADSLYIESSEFLELLQFVMLPVEYLSPLPNLLFIGNGQETEEDTIFENIVAADTEQYRNSCKYLYRDGIASPVAVLLLKSVNLYICRYDGDKELTLNNQAMDERSIFILNYGSSIRNPHMKPVYYSDIVNCFSHGEQVSPLLYKVENTEYRFDNGVVGLHSLSFEILSGNVVGIMGGSGAGKSTLLSVLTGLNRPTKGRVMLNHVDIHKQERLIEGLIGYVTQDDLLVEELTVYQNLYFNAKLCFGQYREKEIRKRTEEVLHELGLYEIRDMKVGTPLNKKISGGQRKRLNIALELIRQPTVLFLDEPTSGLSSRDSDNIMTLLKDLSLKGKLIFAVIHQPSSDIFKMFDRLLVLDQGGYMIYNGDPVDSILYFKSQAHQANRYVSECSECGNVNPEQIFNIVEAGVLDERGQPTGTRRISPKEWYDLFAATPVADTPDDIQPHGELPTGTVKRPSKLKQFIVYATRNILTKLSDTQYIAICLLEAPLLALLLSYIIRYYDTTQGQYSFELNENLPIYIFVAVIIAIFIGLSVSAEEIIKDRKILKREAFLNLSRGSYLLSKILVLFGISAIQAALFVWVGNAVTGVVGMGSIYWLVLFSAWACANMMGLAISDTFKSVVTIYILIPFIVIPQLMLSGVLLRFEKINPAISSPASVPWYGEIITARWAFEALAVDQFMNNDYEKTLYPYEKIISTAEFRKNYWLVEMKNKLTQVKTDLGTGIQPQQEMLNLLCNEIELENTYQKDIQLPFRTMLAKEGLSEDLLEQTDQYLERLNRHYAALYNKASIMKNEAINKITDTDPDRLRSLKSAYFNQSLADMVKNSNEIYRLVEYKEQLLQNYHPIYKDPDHAFIKAQFYAPSKRVFGQLFPTVWVNIIIIWCFNVFFFIELYFRWLPKLLNIKFTLFKSKFKGQN
ncbi:MAG: ATP-binding cassette domain-containing protein [Bacteroidales bacterium]|jgi:ABC-type multidrug transport system ATPase subunit|nr:ATP-binding cassette domain-containing protein [Bacteroidales bacterium]